MRRKPAAYIWDAVESLKYLRVFTSGKSSVDLETDQILRDAVERRLIILGEALGQAAKLDPALNGQIPEIPSIVGLRNVLVHAYFDVSAAKLWEVSCEPAASLLLRLEKILAGYPPPTSAR